MGIFQRAHDIVEAKTNKALDSAENPNEMLDLSYEKMLEQITQVRRALVDIAASEKRIELQETQLQHSIDHLQDQAKAALAQGRDDLAKEALSRKATAQAQLDAMEPQRQQLNEQEEKLTATLGALQQRVNAFRTQKETMKAQYTAAKAVTTVDEGASGISKSVSDSGAALERGAGQDRHHAGAVGRPRRAPRVRCAGGCRWRHRRHPEGARSGRLGGPGRPGARRPQGRGGLGRARSGTAAVGWGRRAQHELTPISARGRVAHGRRGWGAHRPVRLSTPDALTVCAVSRRCEASCLSSSVRSDTFTGVTRLQCIPTGQR